VACDDIDARGFVTLGGRPLDSDLLVFFPAIARDEKIRPDENVIRGLASLKRMVGLTAMVAVFLLLSVLHYGFPASFIRVYSRSITSSTSPKSNAQSEVVFWK
jgi:hypothetical protein